MAVLGGGPAGAATALTLCRNGYSVVIIERSDYRNVRIGETLPPAIRPHLTSLGVWDRFLADKHLPSFGIRSTWGGEALHEDDFIYNPYGTGWHVDRARFDAMLAQAAEEAGTKVFRTAQLLSCTEDEAGSWQIEVGVAEHRHKVNAKFVVDATGRSSWFASQQGAKRLTHDHLIGVVGFFSPMRRTSAPGQTLVEAIETGWLYSAVLPDLTVVAAYMTDADLFARGVRRSADYWRDQLQKAPHTRRLLRSHMLKGRPRIVAANSYRLDRVAGRNWMAVGDAAAALDPLSGQGIYRAIQTALRAVESIRGHLAGKRTPMRAYSLWVQEGFERYLATRAHLYSRESRWPNSSFWQRASSVLRERS